MKDPFHHIHKNDHHYSILTITLPATGVIFTISSIGDHYHAIQKSVSSHVKDNHPSSSKKLPFRQPSEDNQPAYKEVIKSAAKDHQHVIQMTSHNNRL